MCVRLLHFNNSFANWLKSFFFTIFLPIFYPFFRVNILSIFFIFFYCDVWPCFVCCYCYLLLFLCFYFWISSFVLDLDDTVVTNGCSPNNKPKLINGTAWNGPPPFSYHLIANPLLTQIHMIIFFQHVHFWGQNIWFFEIETPHIMLTEHNTYAHIHTHKYTHIYTTPLSFIDKLSEFKWKVRNSIGNEQENQLNFLREKYKTLDIYTFKWKTDAKKIAYINFVTYFKPNTILFLSIVNCLFFSKCKKRNPHFFRHVLLMNQPKKSILWYCKVIFWIFFLW